MMRKALASVERPERIRYLSAEKFVKRTTSPFAVEGGWSPIFDRHRRLHRQADKH